MRTIAIALLAALCITSCKSRYDEEEIRQSAQGYLDAMGNYRIDDAAPFVTTYTREHTIPTVNHIMAHADTSYARRNSPATITLGQVRRISDTSARVYYHKSTPIKEVDDSVTVMLDEGHWLVDVRLRPIPLPPQPSANSHRRNIESLKALTKAQKKKNSSGM